MKAAVAEPGEGPSKGLLRDCTKSPINRFTALLVTQAAVWPEVVECDVRIN